MKKNNYVQFACELNDCHILHLLYLFKLSQLWDCKRIDKSELSSCSTTQLLCPLYFHVRPSISVIPSHLTFTDRSHDHKTGWTRGGIKH